MNQQLITVVILTASAVLEFLKLQSNVAFSPEVMLVLGALSVIVTTVARFLPSPGTPIPVEVTKVPDETGPDEP